MGPQTGEGVGVGRGVGRGKGVGVGVGLIFPARRALKIDLTSYLVRARLKISTSSITPSKKSVTSPEEA